MYTCGWFNIANAKQNIVQLNTFVISAIASVNFEPPLSIATRLSSPEKMIAIPAPTNQSVLEFICRGKAKLMCTIPSRIIMHENILMNLCTTGFVHLYRRANYGTITTKHTTISLFWLQYCFTIGTFIEVLTGINRHCFLFLKPATRTSDR